MNGCCIGPGKSRLFFFGDCLCMRRCFSYHFLLLLLHLTFRWFVRLHRSAMERASRSPGKTNYLNEFGINLSFFFSHTNRAAEKWKRFSFSVSYLFFFSFFCARSRDPSSACNGECCFSCQRRARCYCFGKIELSLILSSVRARQASEEL